MAAIGAAFGLGSCGLLDSSVETPPAPPPVAEASPSDAPVAPPPRPARKPAPPAAAVGSPSEAREPVDPERVIGLDEAATADWLGQPSQRTEASPATIWRYVSGDCEIDVYFYLDMQNRITRALHYEVRSNDIVEQRPERCFQQLVDERQRSGDSASYRPR